MGGKARWRKLRRVVGAEPLGCHAPSRQRFKQDRAKTRDAKTTRDQARADGVEGVEVDVLERMGVTSLTDSKKASRMKKEESSLDNIEIEFHDIAVNGTIIVHVRADVEDEAMGVNDKVEHTDDKDDCSPHILEGYDQEGGVKDHEIFNDTGISKPANDDFSDKHFSSQEDESKTTDQNQTSNTKIVHFSTEPAKIIGDDDRDYDSATDRTVTPSPCSPDIEEEVREDQCEGQDEVQTGEGMEDDDDHGRLETIEECQKETYDEANQEQVLESHDLMDVREALEKGHEKEEFMLCLNSTTVVIDGLGNRSDEDTDKLMPSPEEGEKSEPEGKEAQEFSVDYSSPEPFVLDEDETRIRINLKDTAVDKAELETPFVTTAENISDEYVHEEGTELEDESENLKSSERYYNFKELNITDKPGDFLQTEDHVESVFICNDEVRFTVAPRRDSDILDDSSPDYCVSRNLSMEVNATESVKFFLSDSELSDNEYQTKNTDSDSNDRIQPEDWVDRMDEDENNGGENVDKQDETDDTTDVVIFDLGDTDDEAPSQMDEDDEQNRTLDGEEEGLKEVDEEKECDSKEHGERRWEGESLDLEIGKRCSTMPMQYSLSIQQNVTVDTHTCTDPQHSFGNEYDLPEVLQSSMENDEEGKEGSQFYGDDWETSLHENPLEKCSHIPEQSQHSTEAEKQISKEDKQCFTLEPEIYIAMRHWEARRQRRKLVQCCAALDEQVFAAYRKNLTPCALSSRAVGKYPVLNKETYESDYQSLILKRQSSTKNNNYSTLGTTDHEKQEIKSVAEICSSIEDRPSSVTKEQDDGKDQQVSMAKGRDSIDNQQNSPIEHQHLEYQQFLTTRERNSTEDNQNSVEDEQPSEEQQQYTAMEEEQHLETYQPNPKRRWEVTDDFQNSVDKEQHSEVYQLCLITRKRNSLESQQIYKVGEQHSEDQEILPTKRRNSMEDQRISVMERQTSIEDRLFPQMSRQKSTEEKRPLETEKQTWELDQQLSETKRQSSVEVKQRSMIERQDNLAYQESPRPVRQTSIEEQQTLQVEGQYLQKYQHFPEMERRDSIEEAENSLEETKDLPENQEGRLTMKSYLTSLDSEVLVPEEQTSVRDGQNSPMGECGELRTSFQEDRTPQDQSPEYDHHSEEKRQTPMDDLHYPQMNTPASVKEILKSEMHNQTPDNQEHAVMNKVSTEEVQPFSVDSANMTKHPQCKVTDMQDSTGEELHPNLGMKDLGDNMPSLAINRDASLENPRLMMNRQDSSENPRSMNRQDSSESPRPINRQDSSENPRPINRQDSSENPRSMNKQDSLENHPSMNKQYSVDDDHSSVMNTEISEDDQLDLMEGEVLRADEQYPVLQRQYAVDDQQRPLLQRQSSVESEQYSVVDGLKIRDSFDLYDQKISSPTIDSAYGDRLSLPRDLQEITLSCESKAEVQSQTCSRQDHNKYVNESTSPKPRVPKMSMPFSIVDTFDFDTNEDKYPSKEEKETLTLIHDQSDLVARNYHFMQTYQDSVMKSEAENDYRNSGNRVVEEFDERMVDEVTNRMRYCRLTDTPEVDVNNDENGSYFNTPPSFYPYSSPTPPHLVPSTSADSNNLQYKTSDSKDTSNQYNTCPSKANLTISDTNFEENLNEYEFLPKDEEKHEGKDEEKHEGKNYDEPPEKGKENFELPSEFQSIQPFKTYGENPSDITTPALHTKGHQSLDDKEHEHAKKDIDLSMVEESDTKRKETKEECPDTTFPTQVMKTEENPDAISVSQDIVKTERTISSIPFPQKVEKSVLLNVSKIDDCKLLNKRRRQRRRTKSTTSSDGESQISLDFTDGNFAHKGESPAKLATSAESSTGDSLTPSDTKVIQDDIKEFQSSSVIQGQLASPVEAFTFAHNPEKSADLEQQSKKRFQRSAKKSKSRRKSDPREFASSLSLDDDKDLTTSVKGNPGSIKSTVHDTEESPIFPESHENQKEMSGSLEKTLHATAAGLCKETDKSVKQRQGSPMVKRKPRGYELKRSSSMKTYIREINEEPAKSEKLASDLSRGLEGPSEPIPAPRQYIPSTISSGMPSQLPQPSVHAPRNLFTDNVQVRSSTPPNVSQDQMPGYPRSVLRPPVQNRKPPASTSHPPTLFLEQSRAVNETAHSYQEDSAYLDGNRNQQSSPNANTQEHIDHQFSSLNRSRMITSDMGNTVVASSATGAEAPQQQQQTHAPEERTPSRPSPTTSEATSAKKMRRRRRR